MNKNQSKKNKYNKKEVKNKKKILIIIGIVLVITVSILLLCRYIYNRKEENNINVSDYSSIESVLNVYNIKDSKLLLKNSKEKLADKYDIKNANIKETAEKIEFGNSKVKAIYVRSRKVNLNVIQGKYEILNGGELQQVFEYMNMYKEALSSMNGNTNQELIEEKMYGESQYKFKVPPEESVYVEKRLYSIRYEVDINNDMYDDIIDKDKYGANTKSIYDLNFYMEDNLLVCELVRVL